MVTEYDDDYGHRWSQIKNSDYRILKEIYLKFINESVQIIPDIEN